MLRVVFHVSVLATAVVLAFACERREAAAEGLERERASTRDGAELVRALEAAYNRRDVRAAVALVCLDGVHEVARTRRVYEEEFRELFEGRVERIALEPPPADQLVEYTHGGTRYRMNLEPVGSLVFESMVGDPPSTVRTSFPVGRKGGQLRVATAAPVP